MPINNVVIPIVNRILAETRTLQQNEEGKPPAEQLKASKRIESFRKIVRNVVDEVHDTPEQFPATNTLGDLPTEPILRWCCTEPLLKEAQYMSEIIETMPAEVLSLPKDLAGNVKKVYSCLSGHMYACEEDETWWSKITNGTEAAFSESYQNCPSCKEIHLCRKYEGRVDPECPKCYYKSRKK